MHEENIGEMSCFANIGELHVNIGELHINIDELHVNIGARMLLEFSFVSVAVVVERIT